MRVRFPLPAYQDMSLKPTQNQRFEVFIGPITGEFGSRLDTIWIQNDYEITKLIINSVSATIIG